MVKFLENAAEYNQVWDKLVLSCQGWELKMTAQRKISGVLEPSIGEFLVQIHLTIIIITYILNRGKNRYDEMFSSMPSSLNSFYLNMSKA